VVEQRVVGSTKLAWRGDGGAVLLRHNPKRLAAKGLAVGGGRSRGTWEVEPPWGKREEQEGDAMDECDRPWGGAVAWGRCVNGRGRSRAAQGREASNGVRRGVQAGGGARRGGTVGGCAHRGRGREPQRWKGVRPRASLTLAGRPPGRPDARRRLVMAPAWRIWPQPGRVASGWLADLAGREEAGRERIRRWGGGRRRLAAGGGGGGPASAG